MAGYDRPSGASRSLYVRRTSPMAKPVAACRQAVSSGDDQPFDRQFTLNDEATAVPNTDEQNPQLQQNCRGRGAMEHPFLEPSSPGSMAPNPRTGLS